MRIIWGNSAGWGKSATKNRDQEAVAKIFALRGAEMDVATRAGGTQTVKHDVPGSARVWVSLHVQSLGSVMRRVRRRVETRLLAVFQAFTHVQRYPHWLQS